MAYATQIIDRFGGVRSMARKTGISRTTIAYWKRQGHIPHKHHRPLIDHAAANSIELSPMDFVDHMPARAS